MDPEVVAALEEAGIDVTFEHFPRIGVRLDGDGRVVRANDEITVISGDMLAEVLLKRATELFTGAAVPPPFPKGPTPEYEPFFATIEFTAADYCSVVRPEQDLEFDRIYRQLRKEPDTRTGNPLLSYIQAAARLYMSLRRTSRAEFEGVMNRLAKSARTFAMGQSSTNYFDYGISVLLDGEGRKQLGRPGVFGRVADAGLRLLGLGTRDAS